MADYSVKVLETASSHALLSLDEVKVLGDITSAEDDAQLQMLIDQNSDTIAVMLNRVLGQERVRETWREIGGNRIFLSRWPVLEEDLESVEIGNGYLLDPIEYELEEASGKLTLLNAACWPEPVVIIYTADDLPDDAPPSLKQAAGLLIRQGKTDAATAATAGVRMIAHKESRIMFHPPSGRGSGQTSGSASSSSSLSTVEKLLDHFRRFPV